MHRLWTTQHRRWEVENKQLWRRSEGERVKSPKEEPFRGSERDLTGMRESPRGSGDGGGVVCVGRGGREREEKTLWRTLWRTLSGELSGEILPGGPRRRTPRHTTHTTPHTHPLSSNPRPHDPKRGIPTLLTRGKREEEKGGLHTLNPQNFSGGEPPDPPSTTPGPTYGREKRQEGGARAFRARSDKIDRAHRPLSNRTIPTPPSPLLPKLFNSKLSNFTWGHSPQIKGYTHPFMGRDQSRTHSSSK